MRAELIQHVEALAFAQEVSCSRSRLIIFRWIWFKG